MSYVRLAGLGQDPAKLPPPAPESGGSLAVGIIGAVLAAGAQVGTVLLQQQAQKKMAKEQAKSEQRQAMIQAQLQQQQAALMAAMPQPAPPPAVDMTKIAIAGGVGLAALVMVGVLASSGGKKRPKDSGPQWGPPPPWFGPPPGWGPPPGFVGPPPPGFMGPPPGGPQIQKNRPRRRKAA